MKNRLARILPLLIVIAVLFISSGCGSKSAAGSDTKTTESEAIDSASSNSVELTISAAISLKESLETIASKYKEKHPEVKLVFNYGASGSLQKQIEQGAPVDLFISAGKKQMDALVDQGLIEKADSQPLLKNELVLIVPADTKQVPASLDDLKGEEVKTLAVGDPDVVPAGNYTKEALEKAGLWDMLTSKMVLAKDVRQVLTYVETGNADAGFVYKSDAKISDKAKTALVVNSALHKPIVYPIGMIKNTKEPEATKSFITYLHSSEAAHIFVKNGFQIAE